MSDVMPVRMDDLEFLDEIGNGAFSTVWEVTWSRKERDTSPDSDTTHCKRQSVRAAAKGLNKVNTVELKILSRLSHPNIVKLLGVVDEMPEFFLILELCERGSLRSYLDNNVDEKLHPLLLYCWGEQCARAIEYLHEMKVIHRDVKSPNFLITLYMNIKLCDFGIAKNADLTVTTQIKGTWGWTAPEVFKESHLSPSSDIFAFATLLWEMFTRKVPFDGESYEEVSKKISNGERLPIPPECPDEIAQLMKACWDGDRKKRPGMAHILKVICKVRHESREKSTSNQVYLKKILPLTKINVTIADIYYERDYAVSLDVCHGARVADIKSCALTTNCFSSNKYNIFYGDKCLENHLTLLDYNIGKDENLRMKVDSIFSAITTEEKDQETIAESDFKDGAHGNRLYKHGSQALVTLSGKTCTDEKQIKKWQLVKEYKGGKKAKFIYAGGIAVCSNGDIVVADWDKNQVHLFSAKCVHKLTRTSPSSDTKAKLVWPRDVAVTSHGCIVVADRSKYVKVFDENGAYSRSFCTLTEDEDPDTSVCTVSVVASSQGNILVGDIGRHLVTIHSETDGNIIGKVNVNGFPYYLAVTSKQIIFASDWEDKKVMACDMSGNTVFSIDTWMLVGKSGARPNGLTCDSEDNIYIVVDAGSYDTGHIHMYNNRGEYMRCIAKGLYRPRGITWSNGSLYVANWESILIYSTV